MNKCEHESCSLIFGKILDIDTEKVDVAFKEKCNSCNKIIQRGSFIYMRKD
jgi:hypothetical protein